MLWFKHDSNANTDDKLQSVLLDYGLEGYGLYWYCLELIVNRVDKDNINFELKHDAKIIARNTGSTVQKVEEMMRRFVELGLFENSQGRITCIKLLKRMDSSMTSNPAMRNIILNAKKRHDGVMINHDEVMMSSANVMQDKIRLDKNNNTIVGNDVADCPHKEIISLYEKHLPMLTQVKVWTDSRARDLKARWREDVKRQNLDYWDRFFAYVAKSDFLTGRDGKWHGCDLAWLLKQSNFIKVIEGKYANKEAAHG